MNWRKTLGYERLTKLTAWGLEVSPNLTMIDARVLNPPQIQYGGPGAQGIVRPNMGSWNLRGKKVRAKRLIKTWRQISRLTSLCLPVFAVREAKQAVEILVCDLIRSRNWRKRDEELYFLRKFIAPVVP